jgi:hypothetical protein
MAISRVAIPTPTAPVSLTDYQAQLDQITALNQAFTGRNIVDVATIHAGSVMMIGGVLYKSTTDTTITGTPSKFVKITPSGTTAAAAFVASLSGVAWNHAYGGYYDGSGNLYLFDEARAVNDGDISTAYTMQGQIAFMKGGLDINGALTGVTSLAMGGALSGVTSLGMAGALSGVTSLSMSGALTGATSVSTSGAVSSASVAASGNVSANGKNVPPIPATAGSGLGSWQFIVSGVGAVLLVPASGTWAYVAFDENAFLTAVGVTAGGGTIMAAVPSKQTRAMVWRVT